MKRLIAPLFVLALHAGLVHAQTGDMLKSVYDPQNQGRITGHVFGSYFGGSLNMDAEPGGGHGGSIQTFGGPFLDANGGRIIIYGGYAERAKGGNFYSWGGSEVDATGGSLFMGAGTLSGGNIITEDGGGNIDTRGVGSIEFGYAATRTTLTGSATAPRSLSLPDMDGTIATLEAVGEAEPTKAWVNFDGTTAANQAANYGRSGSTVTVHLTGHNYIAGHVIYADFTSGGAIDGLYTITSVIDADNFTVTTAASGTIAAGNSLNLLRRAVRAGGGIHSVTYAGTGIYYVNFAAAFADANYACVGSTTVLPANARGGVYVGINADGSGITAASCKIHSVYAAYSVGDALPTLTGQCHVQFLR